MMSATDAYDETTREIRQAASSMPVGTCHSERTQRVSQVIDDASQYRVKPVSGLQREATSLACSSWCGWRQPFS